MRARRELSAYRETNASEECPTNTTCVSIYWFAMMDRLSALVGSRVYGAGAGDAIDAEGSILEERQHITSQ